MALRHNQTNESGSKALFEERFTLEVLLCGAVLFLAGWLRFYALGRAPLSDFEARQAQEAWNHYWQGPGAGAPASPFLFWGNILAFAFLGGSDYTARMVSALVGTLVAISPILTRRWLGRWGALSASILLTFSPTQLYFSRTLSEEIAALGAFGFVVLGLFLWLEEGKPWQLYLAIGSLALGLTAGVSFYDLVLLLMAFLLLAFVVSRASSSQGHLWNRLRDCWQGSRAPGRLTPLFIFGVSVFALTASGLGAYPAGIGGAVSLFAQWLASFRFPWDTSLLSQQLRILGVYEFGVVVLGLAGLVYGGLRHRTSLWVFATFWPAFLLLINLLRPTALKGEATFILFPLALGAGLLIGHSLEGLERHFTWREGLLGTLGGGIGFCCLLWLAALARERPPNAWLLGGTSLHFSVSFYLVMGLITIVLLAAVGWWWLGWVRALALGGTLVGLAVLSFSLHSAINLNFYCVADPAEPLVGTATSTDVRLLVGLLEARSLQEHKDPHLLVMEVDSRLQGPLGWYLRDFQNARFTKMPHLSPRSPVAIVLQGTAPSSEGAFLCQSLKLVEAWKPQMSTWPAWWRWYLFREVQGGYQALKVDLCLLEGLAADG